MSTIFKQTTKQAWQWRWLAMCTLLCLTAQLARAQSTFNSGSTGADGAFAPTANQMVQLPESGVFNYTTVNIPAGVTVKFMRNSRNTPVTILASGNVTIAGTIDVSGGSGNSSTIPYGVGGVGGPGGFDGSRGGTVFESFSAGISGNGPGGGIGGASFPVASTGGGGGHAIAGSSGSPFGGVSSEGGRSYGTKTLLHLTGGSGGGGSTSNSTGSLVGGGGGGGGGGAILIASSGTITFASGSVLAKGGAGTLDPIGSCAHGGGGSGGAIRLIANAITGSAILNVSGGGIPCSGTRSVGGYGYVRVETFSIANLTVDSSPKTISYDQPGPVTLTNAPVLRIVSVGGINSQVSTTGSLNAAPDITLPGTQTNPVTVALQAANIPLNTTVQVRLTPPTGAPTSVQSTPLTGTVANSTATASLTLPPGQSLLYATASIDLTTATAQLKPIFIEGERVRKIEVGASFGGASEAVYVTESGRRVKVE